jgi:hypothetical protein
MDYAKDALPEYLKCLPPNLTYLHVPPRVISRVLDESEEDALLASPAFLDCFHHLPKTLTSLDFGSPCRDPATDYEYFTRLSDECFSHLPPSLTRLYIPSVIGITNRFWDIIPPNIQDMQFNDDYVNQTPLFAQRRDAYSQKIR